MAMTYKGETIYKGAVLREEEHMWMDGMLDVHVVVWDMENHEEKRIQTGYYGSDGCNMIHDYSDIEFEVSPDVARDIIRTRKREALLAFCRSVQAKKTAIDLGATCVVTRGRKVPKGTVLTVFWRGDMPTYRSRGYAWMNETETIAGCRDGDGNKVWIKAEYLKNISPVKSPVAAERKKYVRAYVRNAVPARIRAIAKEVVL